MGRNSWCILRSNGRLKTAIKFRMESKNIHYSEIAKIAGVRPSRVSNYLNNLHEGGRPSLTQSQIVKICEGIGIGVRLDVEIK